MDLRQLECVVAVARHEHVTRAAEALHLTQSAVSQHLLRLEAELGVQLFDRVPHGTFPTAAGHELLARAETILADVGGARSAMSAYAGQALGLVRMLAAPGEVPGLEEALIDALAIDPPLAPSLAQADPVAVLDGVRRGIVDLGFLAMAGPAPAGLDVVPLALDVLVVLLPAHGRPPYTNGLRSDVGADLESLRGRPVLLPTRGTAARIAADAAFADSGFSPLPRFEVRDPETARTIVAAGLAVGVVPASWADGHRRLSAHPVRGAGPVRPVLLHRPGLSPAAASLAGTLRAALG